MCVLNAISVAPSIAVSETTPSTLPYFSAISADGSPIRKNSCGINYEKTGWLARDFEGGVRGEIGIAYDVKKSINVTVLFRYSDEEHGKFEIRPEEIRLYIYPDDKVIKPNSVERKPFNPSVSRCNYLQIGEWITLKFPIQTEQVEQVAVIFPSGTVSKRDPINVRPFRFERIGISPDGTQRLLRTPISVPVLPPVSPRFGSFETAAPMPSGVKGTWIIDAKATENLVEKLPRPQHADKLAQWFGLTAGYMPLFAYEFDGDAAKLSAFRGDWTLEFDRISNQETETVYAMKGTVGSKHQTMSVSMLKNGNIRIVPPDLPVMSYLRWKPGQLPKESASHDDFMAAARIWLTSVQAIIQTLKEPSMSK